MFGEVRDMSFLDDVVKTARAYYRLLVPPLPQAKDRREIARSVVREIYLQDRGHCSSDPSDSLLRQGKYVTREDLDTRIEKIRAYEF